VVKSLLRLPLFESPHSDEAIVKTMNWFRRHRTPLYVALYCGFALTIHALGMAGLFSAEESREVLMADTALASPRLVWQFAWYALMVVTIHLIPLACLLVSLSVVESRLQRIGFTSLAYFLGTVASFWGAVLAFNKLYFPRSAFVYLLPVDNAMALWWLGGVSLTVFLLLGVIPALFRLMDCLISASKRPVVRVSAVTLASIVVFQPLYSHWATAQSATSQPNIIIIGIDSLSPLHLQHHPDALPKLKELLRESTVFDNTITPLARTSPAWTSILTGKLPVHNGARFNLTAFSQIDKDVTLATLLKARDYTTIYAQDERKFNNIDESFGFDTTVGPTAGAAEFVLTKVADQPLANLTLLTPFAESLFPFVALNRAASVQYDPDEFVSAIIRRLPRSNDKPLFLAAHFCLAHYPYTWRTQGRWTQNRNELSIDQQHIHALSALEEQVSRLVATLKATGRLDNAILVILSDHGESLGYKDGLWVSSAGAERTGEAIQFGPYSAFSFESGFSGHGSNVLDRTQYQSLLAFRGYGALRGRFPRGNQKQMASLTDVMPTIMHALELPLPGGLDGVDLMAPLHRSRVLPAETGIRFNALSSIVHVDEDALLKESKASYQIDSASARLVVKPSRYADFVATKDIALHTDEWMLALLRKDGSPIFPRIALLVHKPSGAWTMGNDKALVKRAPMALLRQAAVDMYGSEIDDFSQTWAFN
jgi:hypothetical protein